MDCLGDFTFLKQSAKTCFFQARFRTVTQLLCSPNAAYLRPG